MYDSMNLNIKSNILSLNSHRKTAPACNFGNRFYQKEKRPGYPLLFSLASVTKIDNGC